MRKPRVLLADDHMLLLDAFTRILEPDYDVVGTATDGRAVVAAANKLQPDVVLLDISMPGLNGIEAGRQIREAVPDAKLIYLTMNEDPDLAAEAFRLGASAFLLKSCAAAELLQAIREVLKGRSYVTPLSAGGMVKSLVQGRRCGASQLTTRQREVLQLLAEGNSMKEVGRTLGVTARTVAFHKYQMMRQLGIQSSAELVQFAIKNHVISG
jgi:DNA-binding NarL/FixJ family response regulator